MIHSLAKQLKSRMRKVETAITRWLPASWTGYRSVQRETIQEYFARRGTRVGRFERIHPPEMFENRLPCNIVSRDELPGDRGWWGYSFHDVPGRISSETTIATLPDCRVVSYRDAAMRNDFYPAILTGDGRALDLREIRFRPPHAERLRRSMAPARFERATWIVERVYHNHSHWLTVHLPKLLLLRRRGELDNVLLPTALTPAIDASLRMLGLDPDGFSRFDEVRPLRIRELTILATDRFRPQLLRLVPEAFGVFQSPLPHRRIFISRRAAPRRRLLNEDAVWAALEPAGFERVVMEELPFEEQVALMRQTSVLFAPHGAGLTNMLFCPPGADVVEIADLSFPNPNFYALASALGHRYWLLPGEGIGDVHPLEKDLQVDLQLVEEVVERLITGESFRVDRYVDAARSIPSATSGDDLE